MTEERETTYKIHCADGYGIQETRTDRYRYFKGIVRTPLGYVSVYSQEDHTWLSIIHDGYEVTRTFKRGYTKRGLVTLARRFIEEQRP